MRNLLKVMVLVLVLAATVGISAPSVTAPVMPYTSEAQEIWATSLAGGVAGGSYMGTWLCKTDSSAVFAVVANKAVNVKVSVRAYAYGSTVYSFQSTNVWTATNQTFLSNERNGTNFSRTGTMSTRLAGFNKATAYNTLGFGTPAQLTMWKVTNAGTGTAVRLFNMHTTSTNITGAYLYSVSALSGAGTTNVKLMVPEAGLDYRFQFRAGTAYTLKLANKYSTNAAYGVTVTVWPWK